VKALIVHTFTSKNKKKNGHLHFDLGLKWSE